MAGLSHCIPMLIFATSRHFSSSPLHPIPQSIQLYQNRTRKHFTLCATSARKPRVGRKIMEDEELCNDLLEFSALHRLPEGHVPSMKELSTHGRRDLANIVRRRGYKAVGELLKKSGEMKAEESTIEENLVQQVETTETEASSDIPQGQDENVYDGDGIGTSPMAGEVASVRIQDVMSSMSPSSAPAVNSKLQETVFNFIHNGDLDISEDELQTIDGIEDECIKSESETVCFSACPSPKEDVENGSDELNISCPNGRMWTLKPSKELSLQHELSDKNLLPVEISTSIEDRDIEIRGKENKDEINKLKFELHQKELELSKLKEQIEKEKLALSNLQSKAEAEIAKAWSVVAEKDAELSVIEEHLSGLKEVQIQYRGEATTVEVAGSFNGWHLRIKMEPVSSSSLLDSAGSRKPNLWSTTLWLYPGVYEVKFIVDGEWRVDPHSESITKGAIHNNILRVES